MFIRFFWKKILFTSSSHDNHTVVQNDMTHATIWFTLFILRSWHNHVSLLKKVNMTSLFPCFYLPPGNQKERGKSYSKWKTGRFQMNESEWKGSDAHAGWWWRWWWRLRWLININSGRRGPPHHHLTQFKLFIALQPPLFNFQMNSINSLKTGEIMCYPEKWSSKEFEPILHNDQWSWCLLLLTDNHFSTTFMPSHFNGYFLFVQEKKRLSENQSSWTEWLKQMIILTNEYWRMWLSLSMCIEYSLSHHHYYIRHQEKKDLYTWCRMIIIIISITKKVIVF